MLSLAVPSDGWIVSRWRLWSVDDEKANSQLLHWYVLQVFDLSSSRAKDTSNFGSPKCCIGTPGESCATGVGAEPSSFSSASGFDSSVFTRLCGGGDGVGSGEGNAGASELVVARRENGTADDPLTTKLDPWDAWPHMLGPDMQIRIWHGRTLLLHAGNRGTKVKLHGRVAERVQSWRRHHGNPLTRVVSRAIGILAALTLRAKVRVWRRALKSAPLFQRRRMGRQVVRGAGVWHRDGPLSRRLGELITRCPWKPRLPWRTQIRSWALRLDPPVIVDGRIRGRSHPRMLGRSQGSKTLPWVRPHQRADEIDSGRSRVRLSERIFGE